MSKLKIFRRSLLGKWVKLFYLSKYRINEFKSEWFQAPSSPALQNNVVLIICGFGSEEYKKAAQRLAAQAFDLNKFSKIYVFTKLDDVKGLSIERKKHIEKLAEKYPRGWGGWSWKPAILEVLMNEVEEGAEVFYMDAGCEISPWGGVVFDRLRSRLQENSSLFFSIPYKECEWSSPVVLEHFGLPLDLDAHQVQATWFGLINNSNNRYLIGRWAKECFFDDAKLLIGTEDYSNKILLEHRHDQSILSCLIRSIGGYFVSEHQDHFSPELYYPNSWVLLMPVHTLRTRESAGLINGLILKSTKSMCGNKTLESFIRKRIKRIFRVSREFFGATLWSVKLFFKTIK